MANAADARQVLADAAARQDVPALVRALAAVLDAADRAADPEVAERLKVSSEFTAGFDSGVEYAADLAVAALRQDSSASVPPGSSGDDGTFAGSTTPV